MDSYGYGSSSSSSDAVGGIFALIFSGCYMIFLLAFCVLLLAGLWRIFTKAGKPGWAAIVPVYNYVVLMEIIGRPVWWVVLYFIPVVNAVVGIINAIDLAKAFGKDVGYGIGLALLSPIFYPMLGFGKAVYVGPMAAVAAPVYSTPQPPYGAPTPPPYTPPVPPAYAPPVPPVYAPPAPPVYAPPAPPAPPVEPAPPAPPAPPAE